MKPTRSALQSKTHLRTLLVATAIASSVACSSENNANIDGGTDASLTDSALLDSGIANDARMDSSLQDATTGDASENDASTEDGSASDGSLSDGGSDSSVDAAMPPRPIRNEWSTPVQSTWNSTGEFGSSVSLSGDGNFVAIGLPSFLDNTGGKVVIVPRENGSFVVGNRYNLTTPVGAQNFGSRVALSDDGNVLAVIDQGVSTLHVFRRTEGVWDNGVALAVPGSTNAFGSALSISGDGNTIAVGDRNAYSAQDGAVFVYRFSGSAWGSPDGLNRPANNADFGDSVDLSFDGNTIVVGDARGSTGQDGQVSVYVRENNVWGFAPVLLNKPLNPDYTEDFGQAVAISGDGQTIVVADPAGDFMNLGVLFVYTRSGNSWNYNGPLASPAGRDYFGEGLSISHDGRAIAAIDTSMNGRQAISYVKNDGTWSQPLVLEFPSAAVRFRSISMSADGNTVVVGDPGVNEGVINTYARTM